MDGPTALVWLAQNPQSVLLRGARAPISLSRSGYYMQLTPKGWRYCRLSIQDVVANDWQGETIEEFTRRFTPPPEEPT